MQSAHKNLRTLAIGDMLFHRHSTLGCHASSASSESLGLDPLFGPRGHPELVRGRARSSEPRRGRSPTSSRFCRTASCSSCRSRRRVRSNSDRSEGVVDGSPRVTPGDIGQVRCPRSISSGPTAFAVSTRPVPSETRPVWDGQDVLAVPHHSQATLDPNQLLHVGLVHVTRSL